MAGIKKSKKNSNQKKVNTNVKLDKNDEKKSFMEKVFFKKIYFNFFFISY
jgi:hypothetical protein